jgi:hypothetical protein
VGLVIAVEAKLVRWRNGGRSKVAEEGRCRMCLRPSSVRQLTRHHVVKQAWWRRNEFLLSWPSGHRERVPRHVVRDCDAAVVPLCVPCHVAVESEESARRLLRKVLGAAEVAYAVSLRGREWFDIRYPPSSRELLNEWVLAGAGS